MVFFDIFWGDTCALIGGVNLPYPKNASKAETLCALRETRHVHVLFLKLPSSKFPKQPNLSLSFFLTTYGRPIHTSGRYHQQHISAFISESISPLYSFPINAQALQCRPFR